MSSQAKLPPDHVGIELLLELLNASEELVERGPSLPDPSDTLEPQVLTPITDVQSADAVAGSADIADVIMPVEITDEDDLENRFAAHVVRGMSKSKTG